MLWQRILIYFSLILNAVLLELLVFQTPLYYLWLPLFLGVLILMNLALTLDKIWSWRFMRTIALPIIFSSTTAVFILILEGPIVRQLAMILNILFLWLWWTMLFNHQNDFKAIKNIIAYFSWLTFFIYFIDLLSLQILLGWSLWTSGSLTAAFLLLLFWQVNRWWQQTLPEIILTTLVLTLIFLELFWAISFLPFNIYISSFILSAFYYLAITLLFDYSENKIISWSKVKYKIIIASVGIFLALFTAQWR